MNESKMIAKLNLEVVISEDIRIYMPDGSYVKIDESNYEDKFLNRILRTIEKQLKYLQLTCKLNELIEKSNERLNAMQIDSFKEKNIEKCQKQN